MITLGLAILLLAPARAALVNVQSPALEQLKDVEGQQTGPVGTLEEQKDASGAGFTGAQDAPAPATARAGAGSYIFEGKSVLKGVTIYTAKEDPTGTGRTEKAAAKGPIKKAYIYGALAGGAAATIGGIFLPPLLFLGGLLLGVGIVLWMLNRKFAK